MGNTDCTNEPSDRTSPRTGATGPTIATERVVERLVAVAEVARAGPFLAGVVTTVVAAAIGIGVFLLVPDADDGDIDLDVRSVDLEVDR